MSQEGARDVVLTLYSRAYCHLCEEMRAGLETLREALGFELRVLDVDADSELEERFGERVPVLAHGERELASCRLDAEIVRAYLAGMG
jgi:thioredoxin reductase (NADPH)